MYKSILRPLFFLINPEKAHHLVFAGIKVMENIPFGGWITRSLFCVKDPSLEREVFGIRFKNPVGLAAGLDKDAEIFDELANFGFGFIEIGTVTPKAQSGNPIPRLYRLKKDDALVNRMGFNNKGVEAAAKRLAKRRSQVIVGGNIGKNKVTPNEEAVNDYIIDFNVLFPYVDYFAVNVSSPNTPGLRALQEKEPLVKLLSALQLENAKRNKPKPVLLKIAPDLTDEQLDDIIEIVLETKIAGVIATNTTISREGLVEPAVNVQAMGDGGLSGKPLGERSTEVIRYLHQKSAGAFSIIGVGGIGNGQDAIEKLEAGASLVQVYTSFIYEGPAVVRNINKDILRWMKK